MATKVKLTKLESSAASTKWRADFPATLRKEAATYRVTTYPNSDQVYLETWVRRTQVSATRAPVLIAAIRRALIEAGAMERPPTPDFMRNWEVSYKHPDTGQVHTIHVKADTSEEAIQLADEKNDPSIAWKLHVVARDIDVGGGQSPRCDGDDHTRAMREHREKNFGFTSEAVREIDTPLFEGERVYRFTYNGRQEAAVLSLAPHEARRFYDQLAKDFGFDKEPNQ